jgi:hypothetical protein
MYLMNKLNKVCAYLNFILIVPLILPMLYMTWIILAVILWPFANYMGLPMDNILGYCKY